MSSLSSSTTLCAHVRLKSRQDFDMPSRTKSADIELPLPTTHFLGTNLLYLYAQGPCSHETVSDSSALDRLHKVKCQTDLGLPETRQTPT
jgi:hypothetical protein